MTDGLSYIAALSLAVVFVYSASVKLRSPRSLARAVIASGLPGEKLISRLVPALELIAAGLLIIRPQLGALLAGLLLAVFTAFIASLIARGIEVSCGCFGANDTQTVAISDIVRNLMLGALAVVAFGTAGPATFAIEEVIAITTAIALGAVVIAAWRTREQLGQFFDNRLPGDR